MNRRQNIWVEMTAPRRRSEEEERRRMAVIEGQREAELLAEAASELRRRRHQEALPDKKAPGRAQTGVADDRNSLQKGNGTPAVERG